MQVGLQLVAAQILREIRCSRDRTAAASWYSRAHVRRIIRVLGPHCPVVPLFM